MDCFTISNFLYKPERKNQLFWSRVIYTFLVIGIFYLEIYISYNYIKFWIKNLGNCAISTLIIFGFFIMNAKEWLRNGIRNKCLIDNPKLTTQADLMIDYFFNYSLILFFIYFVIDHKLFSLNALGDLSIAGKAFIAFLLVLFSNELWHKLRSERQQHLDKIK